MIKQVSRLDEAQGAAEARTDKYLRYFEGVLEAVTQRFAKSGGGGDSLAGMQAVVAGDLL